MCQPKPGPRCSHHVRAQIARVEADMAADRAAFMAGQSASCRRSYAGELARLHDEYDETPAGQEELVLAINAAENNDADPTDVAALRERLDRAAARRAAKVAALRSTQAGDHAAAAYQAKYGAHAGWLAHADLGEEVERRFLSADYAVGVTNLDEHDEYDHASGASMIQDKDFVIETPVTPGPDGTWVITPPHRPATSAASRAGTAILFDARTQSLAVATHAGDPHSPRVPLNPLDAVRMIDKDDYLGLAQPWEATRGIDVQIHDARFALRTSPDGTHRLHATGHSTVSAALADARH